MTPMSKPDLGALAERFAAAKLWLDEDGAPPFCAVDIHENERDMIISALRTAATASEPVAWRWYHVNDPQQEWRYSDKHLRPLGEYIQVEPLYTHPASDAAPSDRWDEAIEAAAKLVEPKGERPCDCDVCYCGNSGNVAAVAAWDADAYNAKAIRALSRPAQGERLIRSDGDLQSASEIMSHPTQTNEEAEADAILRLAQWCNRNTGAVTEKAADELIVIARTAIRNYAMAKPASQGERETKATVTLRQSVAGEGTCPACGKDFAAPSAGAVPAKVSEQEKTLVEVDALLCRFLNDAQRPEEFLHDARRAILSLLAGGK